MGVGALIAETGLGRAQRATELWFARAKDKPPMHLPIFVMCAVTLAGCASHNALPVASAAQPATNAHQGVEVRHMYLFAPGKAPVRVVGRDDGSSTSEEVSSEPPNALTSDDARSAR